MNVVRIASCVAAFLRYTTSVAILDQMLAAGWSFEGNGATKAFACVPALA